MPELFSPKRIFSSTKYSQMQKTINNYFNLDKRKPFIKRIAREKSDGSYTFRPKINKVETPRITVIGIQTERNHKRTPSINRDSAKQSESITISHGRFTLLLWSPSLKNLWNYKIFCKFSRSTSIKAIINYLL